MKPSLNPFVASVIIQALRYFVVAGLAYLVFYIWKRRAWLYLKIQLKFPTSKQIYREIGYSLLTMLIFGAVGYGVFAFSKAGYTMLYSEVSDYGLGYLALSTILLILLHDTWFYWTHRWMHQPRIFRVFHQVHHLSHNPSPWAAFAFHPLEAIVEAAFFPMIVFVLPLHWIAIVIFMTWMMLMNVLGHTGYELYPKGFVKHPIGKWFNTATHHNMHHRYTKGNYGLYFNIWDRLMDTNHQYYEHTFDEVTHREKPTDVISSPQLGVLQSHASGPSALDN